MAVNTPIAVQPYAAAQQYTVVTHGSCGRLFYPEAYKVHSVPVVERSFIISRIKCVKTIFKTSYYPSFGVIIRPAGTTFVDNEISFLPHGLFYGVIRLAGVAIVRIERYFVFQLGLGIFGCVARNGGCGKLRTCAHALCCSTTGVG